MIGDIIVLILVFVLFGFAIRYIRNSKSCCSCGMNCNNKTCEMCRKNNINNKE